MKAKLFLIALASLLLAACSAEPASAPATAPVAAETPATASAEPAPAAEAPAAPAVEASQDLAWLIGTWELTYDPDNSPKDRMVFSEGGVLAIQDLQGARYSGTYTVEGSRIVMSIDVNGRTATIAGDVSPGRDRISNESGAYYTRLP